MRSYSQIRLTDPEQSVHARDTWQHADRYRTVTVAIEDPTADRCAHALSIPGIHDILSQSVTGGQGHEILRRNAYAALPA